MTGIELIAEERKRQIEVEGFDAKHDDEDCNCNGELAQMAVCYATPEPVYRLRHYEGFFEFLDPYPESWDEEWDKRARIVSEDPLDIDEKQIPYSYDPDDKLIPNQELPVTERIRNLVKAGALLAAEIDRLQREQQNESH